MTKDLKTLRAKIDALDDELIALVARRVGLAGEVASEKARLGMPLLDPSREGQVVERTAALGARAGLDAGEVGALVRRLLALSRRAQIGVYEAARSGGDSNPGARDAGESPRPHP
jgi:chorismate mutase